MPKAATFESIQEIYAVLKFDRKKLTSDRYYSLSKTWMLNDTCCQGNEKTIHKYSRTHNLPYPMVIKIGRQRQPYMQAYRKFMGLFFKFDGPGKRFDKWSILQFVQRVNAKWPMLSRTRRNHTQIVLFMSNRPRLLIYL